MTNSVLAQALFEAQLLDESIYNFQLLLEDRLTFIKDRYKGALNSVVDNLAENIDPSKNKKYTEWLVSRHLKGDDVLNPKVKESLSLFDKASSTAHDTNIKNHTIDSLHDVAHMVKTSPKMTPSDTLHQLYDKDGVKGYEIPNKDTSVHLYGPSSKMPTRWCTSADSTENGFDGYEGGKYTMHFPNGHFLQIHHKTLQTKDPSNTEIDFHADERYKPYTKHINEFMQQTAKKENASLDLPEQHFGVDKEKFDAAFNDAKDEYGHADFAQHIHTQKLSDEQFQFARKQVYSNRLENNPHLADHQIDEIVSDYTNQPAKSFAPKIPSTALLGNPALKPHHVDALIDNIVQHRDYMSRIGRIKNLQPHHIDRFLDDENALTGIIVGEHKLSDGQVEHINKVHGEDRLLDISMHQKVPDHLRPLVAKRLIDDRYTPNAIKFSNNNKFDDHELHAYINAVGDKFDAHKTLDIKGLKPEHIQNLMSHMNKQWSFDKGAIGNPKLPHDFIEHLLTSDTPNEGPRNIDSAHLREYTNRRDAKASTVLKATKFSGREEMSEPDNLADTNFYRTKDMPEEIIKSPEHAKNLLDNLDAQPKFTKEHLHSIIDGLIQHDNAGKLYSHPGLKSINNLLNHPNVNATHIKKLLGHELFSDHRVLRDAIEEHPRTPPSFK